MVAAVDLAESQGRPGVAVQEVRAPRLAEQNDMFYFNHVNDNRWKMKYCPAAIGICALLLLLPAKANCINDEHGKVACGTGQCESDMYGKVFCSNAGGGAVKDSHGIVRCGVGYCAKDSTEQVWCSKSQGGGAAVDSNGAVKCFDGCEVGTTELCQEGR